MNKIINCTPHIVRIINSKNKVLRIFEKGSQLIRIKETTEKVGEINGIPIYNKVFGDTENLPKEKEYTYLIVSRLVRNANPIRKDLLVPNEVVRNDLGEVIGCKSFTQN